MILIAESGSTKCDWVLVEKCGKEVFRTRTKGLNPAILKKKEILKTLSQIHKIDSYKEDITAIYFFGAGCNTLKSIKKIEDALLLIFNNVKVVVNEDIMAAVFASTNKPAIVSILGTGSNCCYFDGTKVVSKFSALGYILMDEGSGNYFGKELLKSYFYNQLPKDLKELFESKYQLKEDNVLKNIYNSKSPNKYLAKFAPFLFENQEHLFVKKLIKKGIKEFIENQLLQYSKELKDKPIYFIGSIAFYAKEYITEELANYNLKPSGFVRKPVDNLITYILSNTQNEFNIQS